MQVGDLVKLTNITGGKYINLLGIILSIDDFAHYKETWTDGDTSWEFGHHLEVVSCE